MMQLTLTNQRGGEWMNRHGKNGRKEVKPLLVSIHDTEFQVDKRLSAIVRKLTDKGWNKHQARYGELICDLIGHDLLVTEVTSRHVEAIRTYLEHEGVSNATVNRYYSALSKIMKYAKEREDVYGLEKMPHITWETEDNARNRYVDEHEEQEIKRIMTARNKSDFLDYFMFLMDTGLRKREALDLVVDDIKTDELSKQRYIYLTKTKNKEDRTVPLCQRANEIFDKYAAGKSKDDKIFQLNYWTIQNQWNSLRESMGLEEDKSFTLHALRHTFASRLAQRGVDFHKISVLMGHKTLSMTKRYSHLKPKHTFSVVSVLDSDRENNNSVVTEMPIDKKIP